MYLKKRVKDMLDYLVSNHIQPYIVGGFVRDTLLNEESNDIDIAVNKPIEVVIKVLNRSRYTVVDTGKEFGTIGVIIGDEKIDIAEFRGDNYDFVSRKPQIYRVSTIEEDLARRDFTINSMAFEYPSGNLIDPYNGKEHLHSGELHTVRNPVIVFSEDPLRILRAIRFGAKYNMSISPLEVGLMSVSNKLNNISQERIRDELLKGFGSTYYMAYAKLLIQTGILEIIVPELQGYQSYKHDSRGHHYSESIAQHMLDTLENFQDFNAVNRLIAFFHDIGKMRTRTFGTGKIQYINHHNVGAEMIRNVFTRLKFTRNEVNLAYKIILNHLIFANVINSSKPYKPLAKFFIDENENTDFIKLLVLVAEADQRKDYSSLLNTIYLFKSQPKLLSGEDVLFVPANLRSVALNKARYYQLIGEANNKEKALFLIKTDLHNNNL